jgi:hypothetical protein
MKIMMLDGQPGVDYKLGEGQDENGKYWIHPGGKKIYQTDDNPFMWDKDNVVECPWSEAKTARGGAEVLAEIEKAKALEEAVHGKPEQVVEESQVEQPEVDTKFMAAMLSTLRKKKE